MEAVPEAASGTVSVAISVTHHTRDPVNGLPMAGVADARARPYATEASPRRQPGGARQGRVSRDAEPTRRRPTPFRGSGRCGRRARAHVCSEPFEARLYRSQTSAGLKGERPRSLIRRGAVLLFRDVERGCSPGTHLRHLVFGEWFRDTVLRTESQPSAVMREGIKALLSAPL